MTIVYKPPGLWYFILAAQTKTQVKGGKIRSEKLNRKLCRNPGGCTKVTVKAGAGGGNRGTSVYAELVFVSVKSFQ